MTDPLPDEVPTYVETMITEEVPWQMFFDTASPINEHEMGTSRGRILFVLAHAFKIAKSCSNNIAEYQALIIGWS